MVVSKVLLHNEMKKNGGKIERRISQSFGDTYSKLKNNTLNLYFRFVAYCSKKRITRRIAGSRSPSRIQQARKKVKIGLSYLFSFGEDTSSWQGRISKLALWCFRHSMACALTPWDLIPAGPRDEFFTVKMCSFRKLIRYYILHTLIVICWVHKCAIAILYLKDEAYELDMTSASCALLCVIFAFYLICLTVLVAKKEESLAMIMNQRDLLSYVTPRLQDQWSPFSDEQTSTVVVLALGGYYIGVTSYMLDCLFLPSLPYHLASWVISLGCLPENPKLQYFCRVLSLPFEYFVYMHSWMLISVAFQVLSLETGTCRLYISRLRSMVSQKCVHRLYRILRVHNKILFALGYMCCTPFLFMTSGIIVFSLYLSIRNEDLPILIIGSFAAAATILTYGIYLTSKNIVSFTQGSEDLIKELQARANPLYQRVSNAEKMELLKSARALRPCGLPVGHYTMFSFNVTLAMYEEIFNQLIFLLSV